jgi:SAM-dependent methyltransferase
MLDEVPGSRFGAAIYNPFLWAGERLGMADRRRCLLAGARGRVLEIGSGTGLNIPHYPAHGIAEIVFAEPAAAMAAKIDTSRLPGDARASVVQARAEELPFEEGSFDTVISTMVLCTVSDPDLALAEIARVLRPGGRLLFCEHVRADSRLLRGVQDRLAGTWAAFAEGCRCDRPTLETISRWLRVSSVDCGSWRGMPAIVKPLVLGEAEA